MDPETEFDDDELDVNDFPPDDDDENDDDEDYPEEDGGSE